MSGNSKPEKARTYEENLQIGQRALFDCRKDDYVLPSPERMGKILERFRNASLVNLSRDTSLRN